jgi:uncharacterized RDD family membrane protein YckC
MESSHLLATPEQVDLRLELADVGSRCLAFGLDTLLRWGVILLFYFILMLVWREQGLHWSLLLGQRSWMAVGALLVFGMEWFYFVGFEWAWNGQTPGKRLLGLRTVREDAAPVGFFEVVVRNFLRPAESTAVLAILGAGLIFSHPRRQRLGDLAARTLVIREPVMDWSLFDLVSTTDRPAHAQRIQLAPEEFEILQRYFSRAANLPSVERENLASLVRKRLKTLERRDVLSTRTLSAQAWLEEVRQRL